MSITRGPWWNESGVIHSKSSMWTPECHSCDHVAYISDDSENYMDNARAISAVPEMMERLSRVKFMLTTSVRDELLRYPALAPLVHTIDCEIKRIDEVLAKANGEER